MKHVYVLLVVPATILIPLIAAFIKQGYRQKGLKLIFMYLVFASLTEIAERILGAYDINNLPLLHFYTIIEFLFIAMFFRSALTGAVAGRLLVLLMIAFTVFSLTDLLFIQSIFEYNTYPRPIAALIIIGLCLWYFLGRSDGEDRQRWTSDPLNWMVTGLLVYFSSSLMHFAFLNIIYQKASRDIYFLFGTIHATLVMLMYLLFTVGFLNVKNNR